MSRPPARPWIAALLAVATIGCAPRAGAPNSQAPAEGRPPLRVAAASDLQSALPAAIRRFEADGGPQVVPTFNASGLLVAQIEQGAPYDVFLSADEGFVRRLAEAGHVRADSVALYGRGSLVLAVHEASGGAVAALEDLKRSEVRKVALANPDIAPYGAAARRTLERAGLWEALGPKLVQAETVRQALQFVQTGNAEAGLVGRAIADVPGVRAVLLDPDVAEPLPQYLGIVSHSARPDDARAFVRFLLGPAGQSILADFGFLPAESPP